MMLLITLIIPVCLILVGAFAGYRMLERKKATKIQFFTFLVTHILLVFFPLCIVPAGQIWNVFYEDGFTFVLPNFCALFVNFGVSWMAVWALMYVIGACADIKNELLH